jgi:hypothetical protein
LNELEVRFRYELFGVKLKTTWNRFMLRWHFFCESLLICKLSFPILGTYSSHTIKLLLNFLILYLNESLLLIFKVIFSSEGSLKFIKASILAISVNSFFVFFLINSTYSISHSFILDFNGVPFIDRKISIIFLFLDDIDSLIELPR